MHGKLKTKEELFRRHIQSSLVCNICGHDTENILHALRDCLLAKRIWVSLLPNGISTALFSATLRKWIVNNLSVWEKC